MENSKKIRLDIGSGRAKFEDYITIDNDPSVGADIQINIESDKFYHNRCFGSSGNNKPYKTFTKGEVDEIRAHHILEHLRSENKVKVMALFYDLLKTGGILNIEVPLFPHPASVQDPTHLSFWTKESFKYFIKDDPFGEAFAKRYSQYPVPLFKFIGEWYKGEPNPWAYGLRLKKVI